MRPEVVEKLTGLISTAVREALTQADIDETVTDQPREMRLFTAREVADRLRLNTQAVYRLAREGKLPPVKLSERTLRWPETILSDFVTRGGIRTASGEGAADAATRSLERRPFDGADQN